MVCDVKLRELHLQTRPHQAAALALHGFIPAGTAYSCWCPQLQPVRLHADWRPGWCQHVPLHPGPLAALGLAFPLSCSGQQAWQLGTQQLLCR